MLVSVTKQELLWEKVSSRITICMAAIIIFFGLSVLLGWYGHIPSLIKYKAGTIATVYNTALCFILVGSVLLGQVYSLKKSVIVISLFILLVGTLGLAQHIFAINVGIDELFFRHYDSVGNTFPGRMAPNTSFCFILSAISMLFLSANTNNKKYPAIVSLSLSVLIFILGLVFIIGYVGNIKNTYAWGHAYVEYHCFWVYNYFPWNNVDSMERGN